MAKLGSFMFISLNGFFQGANGDISWHRHGEEEHDYAIEMLNKKGTLIYGRRTYEMMESYWNSPVARKNDPIMADGMTAARKIVFSRTLRTTAWANVEIVGRDLLQEMKTMKAAGPDMAILGSGSIVAQCASAGLVDSYQVMVDPVVLPQGTPLFTGIRRSLDLTLTSTRTFKSGVVLLTYQPAHQ